MSFRLVVVALACVAVTACAGRPSKTVTNLPIPVPSQTQLAGTTLSSLLLPLAVFPAGTEVSTQESSDTGAALLTASQQPASPPRDCQHSSQSALTPAGGLTAGAFQVLYDAALDRPSSYHQRQYGQDVYQFGTVSESASYFDLVRSAIARCPTLAAKNGAASAMAKQTISPVSLVPGHQALLVQQTGKVNGVSFASVSLFTIDGRDVYRLGETVFGLPLASQPSSLASQTAMLIARVRVYECALACATSDGGS